MRPRRGALTRTTGRGLAVAVLATLALGGCGRSTPGCDRAAADLDAARLPAAAEAYARAADQGEGDCADAGLKTVGARFVTAYQNVARGRAAEDGHNREAAATAYRAALGDDADNAAARDGLARLGQLPVAVAPAAAPAAAAPPPSGPASAPVPAGPASGLLVTTLALLGAVAALLAGLLWRTRRRAATAPDDRLDAVRRRIEEILQADTDHRPGWADEQLAELRTLQRTLDALTVDRGQAPGWADDHLTELRALHRDLDALAAHDAERTSTQDAVRIAQQHSGQLRRDLVDLVAFLDHRLPTRGVTRDRFGAPVVEPETST